MRRLSYWGVRPSTWHTPPSPSSRSDWSNRALRPCILPAAGPGRRACRSSRRRGSKPSGPVGTVSGRCGVGAGRGTVPAMDLAYPPEAEEFRSEIAAWLRGNLPAGWFEPGFSMTPAERKVFNEQWTEQALRRRVDLRQLADRIRGQGADPAAAGRVERGICQGRRPAARRLLRRHAGRPDAAAVGQRGAEADSSSRGS